MLLKLDKNCSETVLLLKQDNNQELVVSTVVLPYPEKEIDIIYLAQNQRGYSWDSAAQIRQEEYLVLDKAFIEHCLPCPFRNSGSCSGGDYAIQGGDCFNYRIAGSQVVQDVRTIRNKLESLNTTYVTMTIPEFFIIKSLDHGDAYNCDLGVGVRAQVPAYHLSKKLDSGFEAIHATNIYSYVDSYGKVCLGEDIVGALQEQNDVLRDKTDQLLNGDAFFQLFFHSSLKNHDLTANEVFYEEFDLTEDFSSDGELEGDYSYYTPAWFWEQAIHSWDSSVYYDYVCHMPDWQEAVNKGNCFCIDHSKHLVYMFDVNEDESLISSLNNVVFKAPIVRTSGRFVVVVVEK